MITQHGRGLAAHKASFLSRSASAHNRSYAIANVDVIAVHLVLTKPTSADGKPSHCSRSQESECRLS